MFGCGFHLVGKQASFNSSYTSKSSHKLLEAPKERLTFEVLVITDVFLITKEEDICGSRSFFGSFLYVASKWGSSEGRCRFILCFAAIRHSFCALPAVVELLHCRYPKTHCATLPAARCSHISLSALRAWHSGESRDGCVRGRGSK